MRTLAALLVLAAAPAAAQEAGWRYSPAAGEGDRAAMGCAAGSTAAQHTCVVIRCEDDFTVGIYVDVAPSVGSVGSVGSWRIGIDRVTHDVTAATAGTAPYDVRLEGDVAAIVDDIRNGDRLYLDLLDGEPPALNGISLRGSLLAINRALYFCAPRVVPDRPAQ